MNPMQMLMSQLMNQLKAKNPQAFQTLQNMQKNQNNPNEMIKQMISKYKPEQLEDFKKYANGFGISNEKLKEFGIK